MAAGPEKTSRVTWEPSYRLVPGRFPPIHLFERVADPADLAAVLAIESFTNEPVGDLYVARDLETAVHESAHHREIFLARTMEAPGEIDMRCYLADLDADLADIRGLQAQRPELYNRESYAGSQPFARELRARGVMGIVWDSVRKPGGECAAAFRPRALRPTVPGPHLAFVWDGKRIASCYEKSRLVSL